MDEINFDALLKDISIYITDQSHPAQRESLPADAVSGFAVSVWRRRGNGKAKSLEGMWCRTKAQAEHIASEYARQYATMAACGWR
ncbi:hypothetical protein CHELA41_24502 [Hyphomicrobiales bacterium]|nr:hypothetical protein CHELA41_24502 [Hyphomicrobiales bacterium]